MSSHYVEKCISFLLYGHILYACSSSLLSDGICQMWMFRDLCRGKLLVFLRPCKSQRSTYSGSRATLCSIKLLSGQTQALYQMSHFHSQRWYSQRKAPVKSQFNIQFGACFKPPRLCYIAFVHQSLVAIMTAALFSINEGLLVQIDQD